MLAFHINSGQYGETLFNGLHVIMVGGFKGNIWAGEAKDATAAFFFDERANEKQLEALQSCRIVGLTVATRAVLR